MPIFVKNIEDLQDILQEDMRERERERKRERGERERAGLFPFVHNFVFVCLFACLRHEFTCGLNLSVTCSVAQAQAGLSSNSSVLLLPQNPEY